MEAIYATKMTLCPRKAIEEYSKVRLKGVRSTYTEWGNSEDVFIEFAIRFGKSLDLFLLSAVDVGWKEIRMLSFGRENKKAKSGLARGIVDEQESDQTSGFQVEGCFQLVHSGYIRIRMINVSKMRPMKMLKWG